MGVFEMHNAEMCAFPVWHANPEYLCTKNTKNCVLGLSMSVFAMHNAKNVIFWVSIFLVALGVHSTCLGWISASSVVAFALLEALDSRLDVLGQDRRD